MRSREVVKGIDTDCTKDTEVEKKPCNAHPCCKLKGTEWTAWSLCSATCGNGAKFRTREVVKGIDGECTKDTEVESKLCSSQPCITPTPTPTTTTTAGNIVSVVKNYALIREGFKKNVGKKYGLLPNWGGVSGGSKKNHTAFLKKKKYFSESILNHSRTPKTCFTLGLECLFHIYSC